MAVGFRKSLFGFNCDDVMNYIDKTHKSFKEKQEDLSSKVDSLTESLNLSKEECENLDKEKEIISKKLNSFNEKYNELEKLSENIGKLYLVAQANAQAIMSNSNKNAKLADEEVNRNIYTIDEAHESLDKLRNDIIKTSDEFVTEVDTLIKSLSDTKDKISANTSANKECNSQFDELYKSIVK